LLFRHGSRGTNHGRPRVPPELSESLHGMCACHGPWPLSGSGFQDTQMHNIHCTQPPGPSRPASCSAGSTIRCWVSIHRCQKWFDRSTARSPSALDAALCPFGSKVQARASQVSSERGSARRKAIVAWMAVDLSTLPVCQCQCQPSLQARAAQDRTKPLLVPTTY
jgi:hypothetical protein